MGQAYRHMALNLDTGEILATKRGNELKRAVRKVSYLNWRYYGYYSKRWVFVHDGDEERLVDKVK